MMWQKPPVRPVMHASMHLFCTDEPDFMVQRSLPEHILHRHSVYFTMSQDVRTKGLHVGGVITQVCSNQGAQGAKQGYPLVREGRNKPYFKGERRLVGFIPHRSKISAQDSDDWDFVAVSTTIPKGRLWRALPEAAGLQGKRALLRFHWFMRQALCRKGSSVGRGEGDSPLPFCAQPAAYLLRVSYKPASQ
eukprot:scaffold38638_cov31-Tisochrysis_lutea.AAC.1